jgi:hypothetical protein
MLVQYLFEDVGFNFFLKKYWYTGGPTFLEKLLVQFFLKKWNIDPTIIEKC